ncbi:MAG TPA: response regulator [Longimicrobium sp.]
MSGTSGDFSSALAGLWAKFREGTFRRVAVLDDAALALREGRLDAKLRRAAEREAHKLAGAAGTFGFAEATDLAREAEQMLEGSDPLDAAQAQRLAELAAALRHELERPVGAPRPAPDPPAPVPRAAHHILAVDDDPIVLAMLRALLQSHGMRVTTLDDPRRLPDVLESERPDLLLVDYEMPHASGEEVCRLVRGDPRWRTLPVVVLTGRVDDSTIQRVLSAGADACVAKPFEGPELIARIEERLR